MAAGYDLKNGLYVERPTTDDELWAAILCIFSSKSRNNTSYKFGFFKAIIDNLYNVDQTLTLSFDQLFGKFGEIYWNLILKYGLKQNIVVCDNRKTFLEQVLVEASQKYNIIDPIPFESLSDDKKQYITHQVKIKCKKYVVGALYEDTNRLFYSFSKNEEWLQINPCMYEFLCKHKSVVEKINYYEWARFLEKVNDDGTAVKLFEKIEECAKRHDLSVFRAILYDEFESRNCFYCGKSLRKDNIDVDHFIPWTFIKDDNLWNMVLACSTCNRKKQDKLPSPQYLSRLIKRNQELIINRDGDGFRNYTNDTVNNAYNWARMNGFDSFWGPDN